MNAFQKSLMAALVLLSFATLFADPNPSSQAPTEIFEGNTKDWKSRRVYQIVTDRFNDNRGQPCAFLKDYCGGTFQGITNKLDYIKGMGFDAIYISPSINNTQGGYHGYWPEDFYTINPKFGGPERLKELVREAHARNIWVMADVVVNHSGKSPMQALAPPLDDESHFHPPCVIDYNNQWSVEHCRISSLPDIDTENQHMIDYLNDWVEWFTKEFNFDGVRLDAVKHVRKDFWPGIVARSGVFAIGEVYHGDPKYVGPYQDYLPSVFNYPLYYTIQDVFAKKHDMSAIPWRLEEIRRQFRDTTVLGTFIDNHDVRRFMNASSPDISSLKNALTFATFTDGIPFIYYGTEQVFRGGDDPANREPLWPSQFNQNTEIYRFLGQINRIRSQVDSSFFNVLHTPLYTSRNIHIFKKGNMVIAVTNSGSVEWSTNSKLHIPDSAGKHLRNAFNSNTVYKDGNDEFHIEISRGEPAIFFIE